MEGQVPQSCGVESRRCVPNVASPLFNTRPPAPAAVDLAVDLVAVDLVAVVVGVVVDLAHPAVRPPLVFFVRPRSGSVVVVAAAAAAAVQQLVASPTPLGHNAPDPPLLLLRRLPPAHPGVELRNLATPEFAREETRGNGILRQ